MSSGIQLLPAELGGIVIESLIYGVFLVLCSTCFYVLITKRRSSGVASQGPVNKTMLLICTVLFLSITAHWICDVTRLFNAILYYPQGPIAYYANLAIPVNVVKTGLYIFECMVGDSLMIYRLWVVWNRKTIVCLLPIASFFCLTVTGIGITYQFSQVTVGENVFETACGRWITSCFSSTLLTNIYCTILISYRIWSINRRIQTKTGKSDLSSVIIIIVESALLYTIATLATFVSYQVKSNFQFPGLDSTSPVIGIVFCLIIIRVSLGIGHRGITTATGSSNFPVKAGESRIQTYPMRPLQVNISQQVHSSADPYSESIGDVKESSSDHVQYKGQFAEV